MTSLTGRKFLRNSRQGFTLIEITLVILLISILVAVSSPLLKNTFLNLELKNASYNIARIFRYGQEMSIMERARYRMNFDFDKGRFWLTKEGEAEGAYARTAGRWGRVFGVPRLLYIKGNEKEVDIYPDGRAEKAEIRVTDAAGRGYFLRFKGYAGKVEVEKIPDE